MKMRDWILWSSLVWVILHCVNAYYSSRRCYGTGDCHLMTKNQDGGFDDAKHQWLVECNDGEGAVAIRDDDTHFEGLSGLWCSFLFPLKQSTRGAYPYYPSCYTRNLTNGEYHCRNADDGTNNTQLFVSGIYKEPNSQIAFVPSLMKCCETPTGYQIDYTRCYYKKTFDRFGEHYTGEWLVKCDTHHLITGIGKDVNPWDNKEHFTWIQCCPFLYQQELPAAQMTQPQSLSQVFEQNPMSNNFIPSVLPFSVNGLIPREGTGFSFTSTNRQLQPTGRSTQSQYYDSKQGFGGSHGFNSEFTPSSRVQQHSSFSEGNYPFFSKQQPFGFSLPSQFLEQNTTSKIGHGSFLGVSSSGAVHQQPAPAMSAIQLAANVAAYKEFLKTFKELMQSYSASSNSFTPYRDSGSGQSGLHMSSAQPPQGYFPAQQSSTGSLAPLSVAMMQQSNSDSVMPPLPSGLQNYMTITSNNPVEALSQLYSKTDQQPLSKNADSGGASSQNSFVFQDKKNQFTDDSSLQFLPIFKTSSGQNYRLHRQSHYEQLLNLPTASRQQYLDFLSMAFPEGLLVDYTTENPMKSTTVPPTTQPMAEKEFKNSANATLP